MHLRRIQVSDFRVLRDVDLTFGADFDPQIFPLGSKNGGGKSTLLQLVFILLGCAGHRGRARYLSDLLASFVHSADQPEKHVATITVDMAITDDGPTETVVFEFVSLNDTFLAQALGEDRGDSSFADLSLTFAGWEVRTNPPAERIVHLLIARHLLLLARFHGSNGSPHALACRVHGRDLDEARTLLRRAGQHIYLLGPTLQQYLFLPLEVRESLTHSEPDRARRQPRDESQRLTYLQALAAAEAELPGFHSYDWLSIEPLIELFRQARDKDFAMAVADGAYGDHYTRILADVNALLVGKRVRPEGDLSGLSFTVERPDGTESKIRLEDLSRGELKRLMIYAWLKTMGSGAVVLMDELEVSLHPDWQLHISDDLHQWAPDNQYILATHSYELCQALTPGHVLELDPPLDERDRMPGPAVVEG